MKSFPRWLIVASGLAMLSLIGGGYWFYLYQEQQLRENSEADLQAIAQLKVNQIAEWRSEQLRDAAAIMESPFLTEAVQQFLADSRTELAEKILSQFRAMQEHFHYRNVMLVDRDGQVRLSLTKHLGSLHEDAARALDEALRARKPMFSDLHVGPADLPPHIDVVAPLFSETRKTENPIGAVIIQLDVRQFLYPLIQFWPTPSSSAETLLVRSDGDSALFLNDLRHQPDTALKLRIPLTRKDVPAVMAVLGKEGIVQGKDYRGVDVLSVLKAVPNSPWFMVAKVDETEALAGWRFLSILILALVIALLAFLFTVVGVAWQKNQKAHYKELFLAEAALRRAEEGHRITLMSVGDGIISTDTDGRVELVNPVAEALTGWRQEEASGKPLEEVFRIFNEETRRSVENPVNRVLREGIVVGLANHTVPVAQDGTERPIADTAAPIRDQDGTITGVVLVFRDRSEERGAQRLLMQEKEKTQHYLDVAGVMLLAFDTNGHVTMVNKKGCEILGYKEGDVLGKDWFEHFLPDEVRDEVKEVFSRIIAGHLEMDEYVENLVLTSSREARLLAWHNSVLRDQDGSIIGILSSGGDITDRKRAEARVRETQRFLQSTLDALTAHIAILDEEGKVVSVNQAWCRFGKDNDAHLPQDGIGLNYLEICDSAKGEWSEGAQMVAEMIREIIAGRREEFQWEYPCHSPSEKRWFLLRASRFLMGIQVRVVLAHEIITKRKMAEEALRESEERFRFAMEAVNDEIWDWDLKTDNVFRSSGFFSMLGYRDEDFSGCFGEWQKLVNREDLEMVLQALNKHLDGLEENYAVEFRMFKKSGDTVWILSRGKVVARDANGEPSRMVGTHTDITERKKAEAALAAASSEWERTFNAISDPVMVLDNHHKILRANKAMADALGTTEQEMIGKSCHELVHGERQPPALCPHSRLLADGKEHFAEVSEPRLGGIHEVRVSPLIDKDDRVIGCVHVSRDITERKRSEEELEKSRASFFNIVERNHDGILVLDTDDSVRYANAAASALFGKPIGELIGIDFGLPVVSEEMTVVYLPRPNAEPVAAEMTVGSVDWYGTPAQLVILHDVTDRMIFEKTLKASEERMRLLIESSPIGIRIVGEGKTLYVNPAFTKIFGYERPEEVMGLSEEALFSSDDAPFIRKYEDECLRGRRTSAHHELRALKKNGEIFDVSKWVTGIEFQGKPAVLAFVADISQEKTLKTQLLQAQKMEAIGTLSGGLAHDFNNILTIVSGFSELLLAEKEENDKDYEDLQKIFRASQNGAELVRRLLTFSRKVEINLRPVKLNLQVKNVEKLLERTIPKTIQIELSLADDLKVVNADPAQIEQVLMNLAVNARHAMPDGGNLVFETRNVILSQEYSKTHLGVESGEYVFLAVSDTGNGMERHVLERIFEPFFTTKKAGEGTGLGLAMVYGIVKGHGGHIACYSELGVGTTFKIHLPVYQEGEGLVEHKTEVIPAGGTETLLMVDDEESVRDLGTRLLSHFGYKVLIASNGLEGLEAYRKNREKIALVILDLIMPQMDGKHCLQELLKMNPQVKVIISSGYSSHGPVSEVMQGGAKGFVQKPYRGNDLLRTVRRILDEG